MKIPKYNENGILPSQRENINLQEVKPFLMPTFNKKKLKETFKVVSKKSPNL